jgi:3-hydroxyisobutyrate dehydrogenase
MSTSIAFIGLGIMGLPMAGHLLKAGNKLTVHTRTRDKAKTLLDQGAAWADNPQAAAQAADVVFICVTDTPDVEAVVLGDKGLASVARVGQIIVDHSTISPSATRKMSAEIAKKKAYFLDAPISGGDIGAQNATLSIMVGGDETAFNKTLPLFQKMGKTITYCGPSGAGQLTKLTNQVLVSITNMAVCEALVFAKENGLDPATTITAIGGGAAGSWQLTNLGPRMIKGDFAPGFMIDLQQKDLRLVMQAAHEAKLDLTATSLVHHLFANAQNTGRGKQGTQALFAVVDEIARKK